MLHYGVEDGLPSNTIYSVYRDSKGFLWIATDKGIARYNGIKFEVFSTADGLSDNEVFFFREDSYERIWMGTFNGELCYYYKGHFHNQDNTPFLKLPIKVPLISCITQEKDSSVTISFSAQPYFINIKNETVAIHNLKRQYNDSLLAKYRTIVYPLPMYHYVLGAIKLSDTAYKLPTWQRYKIRTGAEDKIAEVSIDSLGGLIYLPGQGGSYYYNKKFIYNSNLEVIDSFKNQLRKNYSFDNRLRGIFVNGKDTYIITNSGLNVNNGEAVWSKNNLSCVTVDNYGCYWVSTLNDGLYCFDKNYKAINLNQHAYRKTINYSFARNKELFFVTSDNRLFRQSENRVSQLIDLGGRSEREDRSSNVPGYLLDSNYKFYSFYNGHNIVIDNIFNRTVRKEYKSASFSSSYKTLYSINDKIVAVGTYAIFNIDYSVLKEGEEVFSTSKRITELGTERIFCSAKNESDIWYSTVDRMYKIVKGKPVWQPQFKNINFKTFDFFGKYIVGFTHHNELLICSDFEHHLVVDTALQPNCIWDKFYRIDSNHLLVSTNNYYRILKFNWSSNKPKYEIRAVENPVVPLRSEIVCSDGTNCYFFKGGSITTIPVSVLLEKPAPPTLSYTFLRAGNKEIPASDQCELPFSVAKNIALSYSTVSFGGRNVSYQYSISKDEHDNWSEISGGVISLLNPRFGDYTIKLRAKTLSSDFSTPIIFVLHIAKPYWARWWFITSMTLVLGGLVAFVIRKRVSVIVNRKEKAHEDKVKFMRSEYKALNALMNPHFIFNTLNNVQSLFNGDNRLAANEYLRIFADLIRQNMHNVSRELIPLHKEVDLVTNYLMLEKLRFEDQLNYIVNVDETVDIYDIMVPPLLIQPLVENSIKHGILPLKSRTGYIHVHIHEQDRILHITIKDNGVGMNNAEAKPGSLHESFGLNNIKQRIEQLSIIQNKQMSFGMDELKDEEGINWTVVTITMPLN
jgi:two-component sensor histidine kinase